VPYPTPRSRFVFVAGADFPQGGLFLPASDLTWTVQFQGMGATDSVGVDLFSPPVVGNDYTDYWQHDASGWSLRAIGTVSSDFAAKLEATAVGVPALKIAAYPPEAVLSWPGWATNYVLETSSSLAASATWTPLTNGVAGSNFILTNLPDSSPSFYRLRARR
jgi:hypothetical protein